MRQIERVEPDKSLAPSPSTGEGWGGGGAPLGTRNSKKCANAFKRCDGVLKHLPVFHAEYAKSLCGNPPVAFHIALLALRIFVDATVDFDDDPTLEASEIGDVRPNWNLTPKLVAGDLTLAQ